MSSYGVTRPHWVKLWSYIHSACWISTMYTLRPKQNGPHFIDDISKWIFLNEDERFSINQFGTKPNVVAKIWPPNLVLVTKIWPPNLVSICAWLPTLVANVSSQFHHLVNTALAVGSLDKLFFPCLGSKFSQKATTIDSPPNFSKLIYQSWGITEP